MSDYPEIVSRAVKACLDKHGKNTVVLDMRALVGYTDYLVITTGESVSQVRAVADEVVTGLKSCGFKPIHVEGRGDEGWVLADFGSMVFHVFLPEIRLFYGIEKLWADAPSQTVEDLPE